MSKIYKNQTDLKIVVMTNKDLSGYSDVRLKYKDPDGIDGFFAVVIDSPIGGIVSYSTPLNTPLDKEGNWTFWVYATSPSGFVSVGDPFKLTVNTEGQ